MLIGLVVFKNIHEQLGMEKQIFRRGWTRKRLPAKNDRPFPPNIILFSYNSSVFQCRLTLTAVKFLNQISIGFDPTS